jgi:hypothetical protein
MKPAAAIRHEERLALIYVPGMVCPTCGGTMWDVRRHSAECGRCHLPVALPKARG